MAKDPAFLFYSQDFLAGVSDLTMEERGQYITLLCIQHQKGELTDKTIRLTVAEPSPDLMKHFTRLPNGNYMNERLHHESEKRAKFCESRRENGLQGGRPKGSGKPYAKPIASHKGNHTENENEDVIANEIKGGLTQESRDIFDEAHRAYPGRKGAVHVDAPYFEQHPDCNEEVSKLLPAIEAQKAWRAKLPTDNMNRQWMKFSRWLSEKEWLMQIPQGEHIETPQEKTARMLAMR